ncbi:hypothetical protein VOLCADRAFT_91562 [Volvox carteri f. nagariensis]|uniref:Inosine/uridine-preferring nucleoside hydrolase domain-containing protein n=1 Tax=Volvox carteri f. nagariensis TaxID=3068 RepID=D8TXE4_VOLCA|nr:uncharacterized protein VOLCADRAFT_91562 [Volvox carteri f. nagariensis]EFJ47895.1 hypothetical protein VOLCADRAFT_91562 [Volvox carteri f. nagariensis]|eukprot:XP_002951001.1 hypothetical protein VOLCADRAFT_91562 [Volvox carteri f. nagariensis]
MIRITLVLQSASMPSASQLSCNATSAHRSSQPVGHLGRCASPSLDASPPRAWLWIDTDSGVDDALAVSLALSHPNVEVAGISVVRGNVGVAQGLLNMGRVLLAATAGAFGSPSLPPSPSPGGDEPRVSASCETIPSSPLPPPAFTIGGVSVYGGADEPLASPPQPLTYYYGSSTCGSFGSVTCVAHCPPPSPPHIPIRPPPSTRDGLGDVPHLPPTESEVPARRSTTSPGAETTNTATPPAAAAGPGAAAASALVAAARARPGQLVVVALGPLTNLAAALRLDPELPSLVRGLIVLGGGEGMYGGNVTPYAEFNFHTDPEAASEVIQAFGGAPDNNGARSSKAATPHVNAKSTWPSSSSPSRSPPPPSSPFGVAGSDPRVALITWRCCQRNLLAWEVVDELIAVATTGCTASAAAAAAIATAAVEEGKEDVAADRFGLLGRFLAGILAPFLDRWRRESPRGLLLGDPLAVAVVTGMQPGNSGSQNKNTSTEPVQTPVPIWNLQHWKCQQHQQDQQQRKEKQKLKQKQGQQLQAPPSALVPGSGRNGIPEPAFTQLGEPVSGAWDAYDTWADSGSPWGSLVLEHYVAPCRVELQATALWSMGDINRSWGSGGGCVACAPNAALNCDRCWHVSCLSDASYTVTRGRHNAMQEQQGAGGEAELRATRQPWRKEGRDGEVSRSCSSAGSARLAVEVAVVVAMDMRAVAEGLMRAMSPGDFADS